VVDDLFQLRDGELLADLAEGGDVRGDAAAPALAVTLCTGELDEIVGAGGDARAYRGCAAYVRRRNLEDVDANEELALRYQIQGIPAVKAFRNGQVVAEFVGAQPPAAVSRFLDGLIGPSPAEQLLVELRESGEASEIVAALDAGEHERAFELLLAETEATDGERRERLRELAVALFGDLGHEHPLTQRYRRRLATVLF
jgi:thioredoxin-like negative regulator of GroEL